MCQHFLEWILSISEQILVKACSIEQEKYLALEQ